MHNLKELRQNLKVFKKKFKDRNYDFDTDKFSELDKENANLMLKYLLNKMASNVPQQFQV